jgi:peptidyl-prolyl cis-trans isomerase D
MLQSIRDSAQGWLAWVIVILISIPFALWGINSYLGVGGETVVATVDGREITEREFENNYQRFRSNLRQQLGGAFDPGLFDEGQMRKDVLERMVRSELLTETTERLGMGVSANMVRSTIVSIPSFQVNGRFDKATYERVVRQQGFSTGEYEQQIHQALATDQFSRAISDSVFITDAELEAIVRVKEQRREVSYLKLAATDFSQPSKITEEAVQAHYDANQSNFMAPEQVQLDYVELNVASLADTLTWDDEKLRLFYDEHRGDYTKLERRRASHILMTFEDEGEDAAGSAREQAAVVLERIRSGEDFAAVAKEVSQDSGSATQGGDLGFVEPGMMDKPFDEALFSLSKDEVSDLVRTSFGFHIIKLTDIEVGSESSFEEARDDVQKDYQTFEAERQFYEYSERIADLAYESPDSLEPLAEALGLKVVSTDWLSAGGADIPGGSKSMAAAFSEDVLKEGHNSEVIEVAPEHVLVLRVREHKEAAVRPLAEVQDEITARLQKEQGSRLAKGMLEQVAQGIGHTVEKPGIVGRDDAKLGAEISKGLFALPRPQGEQPSYGYTETYGGDFVIIALHKVEDGSLEGMDEAARDNLRLSLQRDRGRETFQYLVEQLRVDADVTITQ